MHLLEVKDSREIRQFLDLPKMIYKNIPEWIQPLDKDIEEVFNTRRNKAFRNGSATRWLLMSEGNICIGRIAAFVNSRYKNKGDSVPVGGVGFFECINDQAAADLLLDTAAAWLREKGMAGMDGPINFGERDKWWGMVTEGFQSPLYCMNYNPPYYNTLFRHYGFQVFYHQFCFGMDPLAPLNAKVLQRHQALATDPNYSARHIDKAQLDKYAGDFCEVYNKAWAKHAGNKEMSLQQCKKIFRAMKPVMDEKIVWFAYYQEQPIAIFINLPDLNQWFRFLHGKFDLFRKLWFLFLQKTRTNNRVVGVVFGVVPEYQAKGVDSYIIGETSRQLHQMHYQDYEMQWIGDFNPKMVAVAEKLTPNKSRILTTYRKFFDPGTPFQRHPFL
ncbi:hypothetical protein [Flavihumibacter petaseus]|uniref:N-acetyltransferase domain-containing protein n=1 Tax=Flavihumibacter petaseus NBRC 106054 TaxID=1220578 RepID=A0A0E9N580_9BACT|nr:hypothetical protein [Flavihumibacter petaseus]GAO44974.1 hypothetical protein FPE01S_04_02170 [Flavihumibacter petaseus NBRC 106054]